MKQGKCTKCKKAFRWDKEIHSRYCICPFCRAPLKATLHFQRKFPWVETTAKELFGWI